MYMEKLQNEIEELEGEIRYNISYLQNLSEPIDYDLDLHNFINNIENIADELRELANTHKDLEIKLSDLEV